MKNPKLPFTSARQLAGMIDAYFKQIEGEFHTEEKPIKNNKTEIKKNYDRDPEPATFTGLAFHLGFASWQEFQVYDGKFAAHIKRARLRVEAEYEKKLHQQPPSAAMFVLKSLGWGERSELTATKDVSSKSLTVKVIESGPQPVNSEKEVIL